MEKNEAKLRQYFSNPSVIDEFSAHFRTRFLFPLEKAAIKKYIARGVKILNIGCGAGREAMGLLQLGHNNITGLDISFEMLRRARDNLAQARKAIKLLNADALNIPLKSESFDIVLMTGNTIPHIFGHKWRILLLKEIKRVLKKGGLLLFDATLIGYARVLPGYYIGPRWAALVMKLCFYLLIQLINHITNFMRRTREAVLSSKYKGLEPWDQILKMEDEDVYFHWFSEGEIKKALVLAQFSDIEVLSQDDIARSSKPQYRGWLKPVRLCIFKAKKI